MKDFGGKIQYKGEEYGLVFNLNVMETIQEEYGDDRGVTRSRRA